ncbi:transmembrane protein [Ceratobasidium sp. AG-Ba]|nr:transmembrane protein [Ceratobasidium sp. AG-Ba]
MTKRKDAKKQGRAEPLIEDELGIPLARPPKPEEISEEEQWRLINDTGVLQRVQDLKDEDADGVSPLADRLLDTAIFAIPLSFLYILLDILVQQQYSQQPTLHEEFRRVAANVPIIAILVHYTNKHKSLPVTQMMLFLAAILSGPRMIWLMNKGSWLVVSRQAPPLGTIWIYTIIQLNLAPAVASLVIVFGCAKLMNWKIVF